MNSHRFERVERAALLPDKWNELADCYFQQKDFLHYTEIYNPCRQRYYLLWKEDVLLAGASVYSLSLHLFTFSGIPSRMKMQVLGVPVSVSPPGIFAMAGKYQEQLIRHILKTEKGLLVGLNLSAGLHAQPAIEMTMMPSIVVNRQFGSWQDYVGALRSCYRRRTLHIIKGFEEVMQVSTGCDSFKGSHYELYLQVMKHAKEKLETLSFDFFQHLPANFVLTSYYKNADLLCWHITCEDRDRLVFFFGGHDYKTLDTYFSYFNNLFGVLKQFINGSYAHVDLGQTAEIAKMKAGGVMESKVLFIYHRNVFIRSFLRLVKPLLAYHAPKTRVHPFRKMHVVQVKKGNNENTIRKTATIP